MYYTNKFNKSSNDIVDSVLKTYVNHKANRAVSSYANCPEIDELEFSLAKLPFLQSTVLDTLNKDIYDFVNSTIKTHETSVASPPADSSKYSNNEYNDINNLLLQASFWGNADGIAQCLDLGADANYSDKVGRSAIHYSTACGSLESVKLLISRGADVNASDLKFWTPLHIAVTKNYTHVASLLIDSGANVKASLLHRCAPSRTTDVKSISIHFSAIRGDIETTKLLLSSGISINEKDSASLTPIDYAAFRKNYEYLEFIVGNGAKVDNIDMNNRTPLHSAALGGYVNNFKLILTEGCNPRIRDNWGFTPYDLALLRNHDKLIKFMEKNSCDIRGVDGVGGSIGPVLTDITLANAIALALQEPKIDTIARAVKCLGGELCLKLLESTLAVDRNGGMMTSDGKRKRSSGGIFFFLLKQLYLNGFVSKNDYAYIKTLDREARKSKSNDAAKKKTRANNATKLVEKDRVVTSTKRDQKQVKRVVDLPPKEISLELNHQMQLLTLLQKFQQQLNIPAADVQS